MKLGISTFLWEKQALLPRIPIIKENDFKFVEIWGLPPHFNCNEENYVELAKNKLNKYEIKIFSLHTPFGEELDLSILDEEKRKVAIKEVKKSAAVCHKLGGEVIIIHPGYKYEVLQERKLRWEKLSESLKEILEFCETKRIKIALENMLPGIIGDNIEELLTLVNRFASPNLGICLDTGHAHLSDDLIKATKAVSQNLFTIHISDNLGEIDNHFPPYEGNINWEEFLAVAKEISYQGMFMFELRQIREPDEILQKVKRIWETWEQKL